MLDVTDVRTLDRVFVAIMRGVVETGRAPHYAELAPGLGCTTEEARQAIHAIFKLGYPGWVHPGTDLIVSFPPFNSQPTQYRISVGGEQRWFAQCGFEALAACWVFPGRTVRIDAACLDCGDPITLDVRDGQLEHVEPAGVVGHCNSPWSLLADRTKIPFM